MTGHDGYIAHFNWAYLTHPWGAAEVAGFTNNVDMVNRAAERSEGFVKRPHLRESEIHRVIFQPRGAFERSREAATLSTWQTAEALEHFVHRTVHGRFVDRRAEWFVPLGRPAYVIWPIDRGHVPSLAEAHVALARLEAEGAGPLAFDFTWLHQQRESLA